MYNILHQEQNMYNVTYSMSVLHQDHSDIFYINIPKDINFDRLRRRFSELEFRVRCHGATVPRSRVLGVLWLPTAKSL